MHTENISHPLSHIILLFGTVTGLQLYRQKVALPPCVPGREVCAELVRHPQLRLWRVKSRCACLHDDGNRTQDRCPLTPSALDGHSLSNMEGNIYKLCPRVGATAVRPCPLRSHALSHHVTSQYHVLAAPPLRRQVEPLCTCPPGVVAQRVQYWAGGRRGDHVISHYTCGQPGVCAEGEECARRYWLLDTEGARVRRGRGAVTRCLCPAGRACRSPHRPAHPAPPHLQRDSTGLYTSEQCQDVQL